MAHHPISLEYLENGMGFRAYLLQPLKIEQIFDKIKNHLILPTV